MRSERAQPPAPRQTDPNLPVPLQDIENIPTDIFTVIPKGRAKKAAVETMMQVHLDRLRVAAAAQVKVDKARADFEVRKHMEDLHENYLDFIEKLGVRPLNKRPQRRLVLPSEILLARLLASHHKTGALLNQIARALNQNEMVQPQELQEALSAYRKTCGNISEALGLYL
jgi:hypothetical protein